MFARLGIALALLAIVALALLVWVGSSIDPDETPAGVPAVPAPDREAVPRGPTVAVDAEPDRRADSIDVEGGPGAVATDADAAERVAVATETVTVLDVTGDPVEGLELGWLAESLGATDGGGRIDVPAYLVGDGGLLYALHLGEDHQVLAVGRRMESEGGGAVLVVAETRAVEVAVVEAESAVPIEGAQLRLERYQELAPLPFVLAKLKRPVASSSPQTDAAGRARWTVPAVSGLRLEARAAGYRSRTVDLPASGGLAPIELEPAQANPVTEVPVELLVVDREGVPLAGAEVREPGRGFEDVSLTDLDGRCSLVMDPRDFDWGWGPEHGPRPGVWVRHAEVGVERFDAVEEALAAAAPHSPDLIVLRFASEPLAIAGRLVARDGSPLAGWTVRPHGATLVNPLRFVDREDWAEGPVEAVVEGDGSFALGPLLDRSYDLVAVAPPAIDGRSVVRRDGVAAGTDGLLWRLGERDLLDRLAGQVVDGAGQPIEGARVAVEVETFNVRASATRREWETRRSEPTGPDGRFELRDVPGRVATINVRDGGHPPLEPLDLDVATIADPERARLVVERQKLIDLKLEGSFESPRNAVHYSLVVVDGAGESLPLRSTNSSVEPLGLQSARHPTYWVSSRAVEARIVLRDYGVGRGAEPGEPRHRDEVLQTWALGDAVTVIRFSRAE